MSVVGPLILSVVMVAIVIVMLRNGRLREKYAILWLVIGTLTIILAVFPRLLRWAASLVGVLVPSNLLFALSILLLVGVALHVSRELTILEDETRILAEEVAILRTSLEHLQSQGAGTQGEQNRPARAPAVPEATTDPAQIAARIQLREDENDD